MLNQFEKDFWKTKVIINSITASASGWASSINDPQKLVGPLIFLYVYDRPTEFTWMCAMQRDVFSELTQKVLTDIAKRQNMVAEIRGGLARIIQEAAGGRVPSSNTPAAGNEWELQLAYLIAAYASTTKTFEVAKGMAGGGHFVVLNYRHKDDMDGMLRPFAMHDTDNSMMSHANLMNSIAQVIEVDDKNHPEWFALKGRNSASRP